tara:strand:- start:167 stop:421 length:255 start_codon:yes stop_codon:yes gene_type:complete
MRNLLIVLVFVSITILGCGENNSLLEKCADKSSNLLREKITPAEQEFLNKSLKEKLQYDFYEYMHSRCEEERMKAPKTFDAKYQ